MLTPEQKDAYIKGGGTVCPYCGSRELSGEEIDADGAQHWQNIICLECKAEWTDVYALSGIDELKKPIVLTFPE